jgi:hypothetical protein
VSPNRQHRRAALLGAAALVAAIVADLVEMVVDPIGSGDAADVVYAATSHSGRLVASAVALLASAVFVVPAALGLLRALDRRGRRIGLVAAGLALLGAMGHAALAAAYLLWGTLPATEANRDELVAIVDGMLQSGSVVALTPLFVAFPLSLLAIFAALVRGRIVPIWVLVPVLAAPVADAVLTTTAALACFLVAAAVLVTRLVVPRGDIAHVVTAAPATET